MNSNQDNIPESLNSDAQRRANAQGLLPDGAPGVNFIPDANTPAQPITPVPEAVAACPALRATLPDLTGEAKEAAGRQLDACEK
jgi:hypothetical protein